MLVYHIMINEYNPIKATRDLIKSANTNLRTLHSSIAEVEVEEVEECTKWCFITISKLIAAIKRNVQANQK